MIEIKGVPLSLGYTGVPSVVSSTRYSRGKLVCHRRSITPVGYENVLQRQSINPNGRIGDVCIPND